jgi:hypothetical protein
LAIVVSEHLIKKQGGNLNFNGLSQDGGRADFTKNLLTSLFLKYLSNEPNFSRIHFAGQYLSQNHRFFKNIYIVHSLLGLQAKVKREVLPTVLY